MEDRHISHLILNIQFIRSILHHGVQASQHGRNEAVIQIVTNQLLNSHLVELGIELIDLSS